MGIYVNSVSTSKKALRSITKTNPLVLLIPRAIANTRTHTHTHSVDTIYRRLMLENVTLPVAVLIDRVK